METSRDPLVERLVHLIDRWGLVAPAITFLEANKPLGFVGGQALLMLQPIADFFVTRELTTDVAALLSDRNRLETLISNLESVESRK
jgi:hypothetical protein